MTATSLDATAPDDTASDDTAPDDTASDDTASDDTASDDTASDDSPLDQLARGVDEAVRAVESLDSSARAKALALKQAIEAFHKEGLATMIRTLKADPRGLELLLEMVEDSGVYALFAMHGLVKADLATRVAQVLDATRPYLQSHGGDVELVAVEGDTAKVRLQGACSGCSQSAVTLRESVEEALTTRIPEIARVEQVENEVSTGVESSSTTGFVPLDSLRPSRRESHGWRRGPRLDELEDSAPHRLELDDVCAVVIRLGESVQAFRNECAHQGLPIDGGRIDEEGTLTCPWHGFRFDATTGECLTSPAAQLEPFPLRIEDGVVWVRPS
ncbi:MAG: NifU family protein [Acidobacteriota bacterium]